MITPSDYLNMTFKLSSKDMAKVTDNEQQLKTNKSIVRKYLDNSRVRLTNHSREALALVTLVWRKD